MPKIGAGASFRAWVHNPNGPYMAAYHTVTEQLKIQADELVAEMKRKAPVYHGPPEPEVQQGALRNSIRVEPGKDVLHVRVVAGGATTTRNRYDYANAVEFGTQKMRSHPFFFSTYRAMKRGMREEMKEKLGHVIRGFSAETNE